MLCHNKKCPNLVSEVNFNFSSCIDSADILNGIKEFSVHNPFGVVGNDRVPCVAVKGGGAGSKVCGKGGRVVFVLIIFRVVIQISPNVTLR